MSTSDIQSLLKQGIAAAKQGDNAQAQELLLRVTELDEKNEPAWLWLSGVLEDVEDRIVCLENVLTVNPENSAAARGLRLLQAQLPPAPTPATPPADLPTEESADAWIEEEPEPEAPTGAPADAIRDDLDKDVIICVHCNEPNALWRVTCSSCLKPLHDEVESTEAKEDTVTSFVAPVDELPEEEEIAPEIDKRPQGLLTLVAAWIAAMLFNRRGAYEYEIYSASAGRTITGVVIGGVAIPLIGGFLLALIIAAGSFNSLLEQAASLGTSLTLLAWGGAALALGTILGFYIWAAGLYLIAWPLGGKASFAVHAQLLSVAYAASSLLTFVLMIIGGALFAFLAESSPAAEWIGTLGLPLLGLVAALCTLGMNSQAVSVAHRFSWLGGLAIVLLTALVFGLLSVIIASGVIAYAGGNPVDLLNTLPLPNPISLP